MMLVLTILLMSVMNLASADSISKDLANTSCELLQVNENLTTCNSEIQSVSKYFTTNKVYYSYQDILATIEYSKVIGDYYYSGTLKRVSIYEDGTRYRVKYAGRLKGDLFR